MAVSIISGKIIHNDPPELGRIQPSDGAIVPEPFLDVSGGIATFGTAIVMNAEGEVRFAGLASDRRDGWLIGWLQARFIEADFAYYRGAFDRDGSIFIQRAGPSSQICRDVFGERTPVDVIFYRQPKTLGPNPFPLTINTQTEDGPFAARKLVERNKKTHKDNYLHEVFLERHFYTVLTVRDPKGNFHHQGHFAWNWRWQFRFQPRIFPPTTDRHWILKPVSGGARSTASRVFTGAPRDPHIKGVLTGHQKRSCNQLGEQNRVKPFLRRDFLQWETVRRPRP